MRLLHDLEWKFRKAVKQRTVESKMPILMGIEIEAMARGEAIGEARGEARGMRRALFQILRTRFGDAAESTRATIEAESDPNRLEAWTERAVRAGSLTEFEAAIRVPADESNASPA